jgi:hypothetical protein
MFPLYDLNPHRRFPWLTVAIIAVNVGITFWMSSLGERQGNEVAFEYGFVPLRLSHVDSGQPLALKIPIQDRRGRVVIRHDNVSARRLAAHVVEHVDLVDLRQ